MRVRNDSRDAATGCMAPAFEKRPEDFEQMLVQLGRIGCEEHYGVGRLTDPQELPPLLRTRRQPLARRTPRARRSSLRRNPKPRLADLEKRLPTLLGRGGEMFQPVGRVAVAQQHNREVIGRLLHLSVPALSETETIALYCIERIAEEGRVAYRDEIQAAIGSQNMCGSTATGIVNRLVASGHIEHVLGFPIQRGMWLRIVATGQQTAEPKCTSPHWRYRKEAVPSPAIHQIRERNITLARMIEDKARELGKPISEYLMDCVYVGHHEIAAGD